VARVQDDAEEKNGGKCINISERGQFDCPEKRFGRPQISLEKGGSFRGVLREYSWWERGLRPPGSNIYRGKFEREAASQKEDHGAKQIIPGDTFYNH